MEEGLEELKKENEEVQEEGKEGSGGGGTNGGSDGGEEEGTGGGGGGVVSLGAGWDVFPPYCRHPSVNASAAFHLSSNTRNHKTPPAAAFRFLLPSS